MNSRYTLGKNERLKSRRAIDELFKQGKRFSVPLLRVCWKQTEGKSILLGVSATGKNFSRSVDRNKIKRMLREAWRLQKFRLQHKMEQDTKGLDVFLICTATTVPAYTELALAVTLAIDKLEKLIES